jgi:hypothetical protein
VITPRSTTMAAAQTAANAAPRPMGSAPFNPERPSQLIAKYAKFLGKDLASIDVSYTPEGVSVTVTGAEGGPYADLENVDLAVFKAKRNEVNRPSNEEALQGFRNKFELRLNREFPTPGPASGSDADIQAFLNGLNFRERRALLMTQKQFSASYPNGYTQA